MHTHFQSCLMCVSFHPTQPALIAGGTFSGEVRLWNTGVEIDPLLASSGLSDLGHKEPVSKVRGASMCNIRIVTRGNTPRFGVPQSHCCIAGNFPIFTAFAVNRRSAKIKSTK